MRSILQHTMILVLVFLCISCRKDEAEIIPRGKMSKIYAEMLVTDQWINSTPGVRLIADTSMVYEPILRKYGYTVDDYIRSVDNYMDDPERFSRILRTSGEIIEKRMKELRKELHLKAQIANLPKVKSDFNSRDYFPYFFGEPYVHYYDSLGVEMDSLKLEYRFVSIERADTVYDRIRMIILDTIPASDSLAVNDSLAVSDSIRSVAVSDSLVAEKVDTTVAKESSGGIRIGKHVEDSVELKKSLRRRNFKRQLQRQMQENSENKETE